VEDFRERDREELRRGEGKEGLSGKETEPGDVRPLLSLCPSLNTVEADLARLALLGVLSGPAGEESRALLMDLCMAEPTLLIFLPSERGVENTELREVTRLRDFFRFSSGSVVASRSSSEQRETLSGSGVPDIATFRFRFRMAKLRRLLVCG
jgi:hypothetical protein